MVSSMAAFSLGNISPGCSRWKWGNGDDTTGLTLFSDPTEDVLGIRDPNLCLLSDGRCRPHQSQMLLSRDVGTWSTIGIVDEVRPAACVTSSEGSSSPTLVGWGDAISGKRLVLMGASSSEGMLGAQVQAHSPEMVGLLAAWEVHPDDAEDMTAGR
ncbi:hypothetical protein Tco_1516146 [Tanacetum coccineum]